VPQVVAVYGDLDLDVSLQHKSISKHIMCQTSNHVTQCLVSCVPVLCPLQVVGVYGDLDLDVSLSHQDAFRMVVCLRKQQQGEQ
jgi:hypothetical protein